MSSSTPIPRSITAAQARSNLGQIIRRASGKKKERFVIGLRGEPKAVVLGIEDYLDLMAPTHPLLAEIHAFSVANGGDKITMEEIDAEIAAYRAEQRVADAESVCRS
jgi:prevent-host-death family protein